MNSIVFVTEADAAVAVTTVADHSEKSQATRPFPVYRKHLTTDEAANILCLRPQTLRKAYAARGSYGGVIPTKCAANRRLYWEADAVRRLIERE